MIESAAGRNDDTGVHLHREILEIRERGCDRLFQLRRRCQIRIAQPIVTHHPAFVGIGNGTGFECLDVGEGLVDLRLHAC